jgi:accessory colonization factor AcfC
VAWVVVELGAGVVTVSAVAVPENVITARAKLSTFKFMRHFLK